METEGYCGRCPRRSPSPLPGKSGACRTDGRLDARLLVVGMAPGNEELGKTPFVGPSGHLLWWAANQIGFKRDDVRLMNVCNCWPIAAHGKNLDKSQISACWSRFDAELMASTPRVILCLGSDAFRRVAGGGALDGRYGSRGYLIRPSELQPREVRQQVSETYKAGRKCSECAGVSASGDTPCAVCDGSGWHHRKGDGRLVWSKQTALPALPDTVEFIVVTYHPSYVIKKQKKIIRAFLQDTERAWRAANELVTPLQNTAEFETSPSDLGDGLVAFDIETNGEVIDRMGMATDNGCWTAPWNLQTIDATRYWLGDTSRLKVGHNIHDFDIRKLEHDGISVAEPTFDTMVAGMMIEPDLPKGLASMAPLYLDLERWKWMGRVADPAMEARYNAYDCIIERELAKVQLGLIEEWGMQNLVMGTVMPSLNILRDMSEWGIRVDQPLLVQWRNSLYDKLQVAITVWNTLSTGTDPLSNQKVGRLLYDKLKMERQYDPETGNTSVDVVALRTLKAMYSEHASMLDSLIEVRFVHKRLTTYAKMPVGADGKVHPRFMPRGKDEIEDESKRKGTTATGRLASADPNIQNIDKQDPMARSIFIPSHPDWVFVGWDYEQAEPRVSGAASADRNLQAMLDAGADLYEEFADGLEQTPRAARKMGVLATFYGSGPKTIADQWKRMGINLRQKDAVRLQANMARRCPNLMAWFERVAIQGQEQGYVVNHFSRRRYFWQGVGRDAPAMKDFIPQSDVADVLWNRLRPIAACAAAHDGHLLAQIHDEFIAECPRERAVELALAGKEVLQAEFSNIAPGFRLPVTPKIGRPWSEMKPLAPQEVTP